MANLFWLQNLNLPSISINSTQKKNRKKKKRKPISRVSGERIFETEQEGERERFEEKSFLAFRKRIKSGSNARRETMTLARFVIRAKAFRFRGEEGWLRSRLINIRAIKVLPRRLALDCGCENDPLRGILARYVTRQPQFTQRGTSLCSRGDESCPRFDGVKTLDLGV